MMFKCFLLVAVVVMTNAVMDLSCGQEGVLTTDGMTYYYPSNCNMSTTVTVQTKTAGKNIFFTEMAFMNKSNIAEDAMLMITVMDGTDIISMCDTMNMTTCYDRASTTNKASIKFEASLPMGSTLDGYGFMFTATAMSMKDVAGYVNCRCMEGEASNYGQDVTMNVTVPANESMTVSITPCAGTWCTWNLATDLDQTFNITLDDVSSITNNMTVPTRLGGKMIDVYGTMEPVGDYQIHVSNTTMTNTSMMYSSQFKLMLGTPYISYAEMMSMSLMPQTMSSLTISTGLQPTGLMNLRMVKLDDTNSMFKAFAKQQPYDFPNVVYQWEIMVNNKDKSKYNLFWEQNSCSGLTMSNKVDVRKTPSNGQIIKTFDSCTKAMEFKSMSTGEKTVFVQYTRSNASLVTGDWAYTFSSTEINSSSMTTASMLTVVLAAVIAMFK